MLENGGFGEVYKGLNRRTTKEIAIKKILLNKLKISEFLFPNSVSHPNLLKTIEYVERNLHVYKIMDLCACNLQQLLTEIHHLEGENLEAAINQMASGCYALFQKNILHLHIKPQNVLVVRLKDEKFVFKLSDFDYCTPLNKFPLE